MNSLDNPKKTQEEAALSCSAHIDFICRKAQQGIYFLRRLRSSGADTQTLLFFSSVLQRVSCLSVKHNGLLTATYPL